MERMNEINNKIIPELVRQAANLEDQIKDLKNDNCRLKLKINEYKSLHIDNQFVKLKNLLLKSQIDTLKKMSILQFIKWRRQ